MAPPIRRARPTAAPVFKVIPIAVAQTPATPKPTGPVRRRGTADPALAAKVKENVVASREAEIAKVTASGSDFGSDALRTIQRYFDKVKNPLTAIRANCVECSGGSLKDVAECKIVTCALHPFRHGTNPLHKKTRDRMAAQPDEDGDGE